MKKYVFIDIDGTLYDHGNHCIPDSALCALKKAKEQGHELFICTGRPKPVVESSYLNLPITGVIYSGGTHIEVNQSIVFKKEFPVEKLSSMLEYFQNNECEYTLEGIECNVYTKGNFDLFQDYFCKGASDDNELKLRFEKREVLKLMEELNDEDLKQITKIDVFAKYDQRIYDFIASLPEGLEGFVYSDPVGDLIEAEILIEGISKASGMDEVLNYFGGELKDTIAIGDSTNDMAMIEHAAIGIAMGNACQQLKDAADFVSAPVDQDGLYLAFQQMGLFGE